MRRPAASTRLLPVYRTGRDVARRMYAPWHDKYTLPSLMDFYRANRESHGAQRCHARRANAVQPLGREPEIGVIREGMLADMLIVPENPIQNLKVLYGTGWQRLNDQTRRIETVGGVRWTIKDGIVYDARKLLEDVAKMVEAQKAQRARATSSSR